jgi:cell division protease FtsH
MRKRNWKTRSRRSWAGRQREIIFGDISTGAHNDLARATDITRSMIREYGMSEKLGQVYLAGDKQPLFMSTGLREAGDYSEATSEIIDLEIRDSIRREYDRALAILREKKEILIRGARLLLEKEKLDGEEIRALLASPPAAPEAVAE